MSVTDLGSAVPSPGGPDGSAELAKLTGALEAMGKGMEALASKLGSLNPGGKGGPSTGGGRPAKSQTDKDRAKLDRATDSFTTRVSRLEAAFSVTGKMQTATVARLMDDFKRLSRATLKLTGSDLFSSPLAAKLMGFKQTASAQAAARMGPKVGKTKEELWNEKQEKERKKRVEASQKRRDAFDDAMGVKFIEGHDYTKADLRRSWKDGTPELGERIRDALVTQQQTKQQSKMDELRASFVETIRNKFSTTGQVNTADLQRAMKLGMPMMVNAIRDQLNRQTENKYLRDDAKRTGKFENKEQAKTDAFWKNFNYNLQTNNKHSASLLKQASELAPGFVSTMEKWNKDLKDKAQQAKDATAKTNTNQARREREQAFFDRIQRRMSRGLNLTEGHLEKAKGMGMTSLSRTIESRLAKQKSDAADKRVQDFEMAQHNKQVDAERKAKEKAEREAKQGSGKGNFFGGFARNMAIGRLYAAANAAAAPLEAFATGIGVHWLKAWKTLTSVAFEAGKNISYTSGMAESANGVTNTLKFTQARLERQNSLYEMNSAVGSRAAAGMAGSSAGLAKGVAEAVGNALDNPLTGFTDIVGKIGNAVGMADPGTMNRYNMILRDLTATIGQGLVPVVQMITKLMKEFGDYLQPVIQTALPEIRKAMSSLFAAIQPLIPLFVKELGDTIKELIELIGQIGGKLGVREMIMRGVGVPDNIIKAGPGNGAAAVQQDRTMIGVGGGVLGGAALGAGLGSVIPGVGTLIGGVAGGVMGGIAGYMDSRPAAGAANGPAGIGNIMNQIGAMQKGNISGAAVAQNATIGSGSDIARKASQEAFISSSARGNIEQQNVFQVAAQAAIQFFQNANKPAKVANGNAQPGIAAGQADVMKFGAGQPKWVQALMNFGG